MGAIICIIFEIIFGLFIVYYMRPVLKYFNKEMKIILPFKNACFSINNIARLEYKTNKIKIITGDRKKYNVSNYYINFEMLLKLFEKEKFEKAIEKSFDNNEIKLSIAWKTFPPLFGLILIACGILVIAFANKGQNVWPAYLFVVLGILIIVFFLIVLFRWKLIIKNTKIEYTSPFGKKKIYSVSDISSITVFTFHGRGGKEKKIYLHVADKVIVFPYRYKGVQKLINRYGPLIKYF